MWDGDMLIRAYLTCRPILAGRCFLVLEEIGNLLSKVSHVIKPCALSSCRTQLWMIFQNLLRLVYSIYFYAKQTNFVVLQLFVVEEIEKWFSKWHKKWHKKLKEKMQGKLRKFLHDTAFRGMNRIPVNIFKQFIYYYWQYLRCGCLKKPA